MDPYLELHWLDVHAALVVGTRNALNRSLPPDLVASAEEHVGVESEEGNERLFAPDVRVFAPDRSAFANREQESVQSGSTAVAPYRLFTVVEDVKERYVSIVEAGTERLVTVIEFVSPTNKTGEGLTKFRAKRSAFLAANVNFVEVDLILGGNRAALFRPHRCPGKFESAYRTTIRKPADPDAVYIYPMHLRERLPSVEIPLRVSDPEVSLDLQALVNQAYDEGRYARRLKYAGVTPESMSAEDAEWVEQTLRASGRLPA